MCPSNPHLFLGCGPIQAIFNTWQFFLDKSPRSCLLSVCYPCCCCLRFLCNFSDGPLSFEAKLVLRKVREYNTLCREINTSLFPHEDSVQNCYIVKSLWLHPSPCPSPLNTLVFSSPVNWTQALFPARNKLQHGQGPGKPTLCINLTVSRTVLPRWDTFLYNTTAILPIYAFSLLTYSFYTSAYSIFPV